jgi:hypothetical protein
MISAGYSVCLTCSLHYSDVREMTEADRADWVESQAGGLDGAA